MSTILAILALATFGFAVPFFFVDMNKVINDMSARNKKWEDLKKAKEAAEAAHDYAKAAELEEELENSSLSLLGKLFLMVSGCCLYVLAGLGHTAMEIFVTVTALTTHVGNPIFGFISLGVMAALMLYGFLIAPKITAKEKAEAEALGNIYVSKTNWVTKILGTIPDIYALYVFLVLIGVITFAV